MSMITNSDLVPVLNLIDQSERPDVTIKPINRRRFDLNGAALIAKLNLVTRVLKYSRQAAVLTIKITKIMYHINISVSLSGINVIFRACSKSRVFCLKRAVKNANLKI